MDTGTYGLSNLFRTPERPRKERNLIPEVLENEEYKA